jgi:hypothetical protein
MTAKRRRLVFKKANYKGGIDTFNEPVDIWDNVAISESVPEDMIIALNPDGQPVGCIFNIESEGVK